MKLKENNGIYNKLEKCKELIKTLDYENCKQRELLENLIYIIDTTWKTVDDFRETMES